MNIHQKIILIAILAVAVVVSGCTTQTGNPSAPTAATSPVSTRPAGTSLDTLPGMALALTDLPPGFEMIYEGETLPPDESTLLSDPDYQGGYSVSFSNESSELSAGGLIDQTILVYSRPVTREYLKEVFFANYPDIANWSLTPLADPGLGDASVAYGFVYPNTTLSGYMVAFGKGDVYEFVLTMATDETTDYTLLQDLARKAASRVR